MTLKKLLQKILFYFRLLELDPPYFVLTLRGLPYCINDFFVLKRQLNRQNVFRISRLLPYVSDRFNAGGLMKGQYFHQDLHVAKRIFRNSPAKHVDIGSRMDGFVAHVAVFREIEVFDIRPVKGTVPNIKFTQADLMNPEWGLTDYCDSVSCLHALEHFGLGRYGDPVDAEGHLKGFENISKTLRKGGRLYLSVPIGRQRIEFNAHRVFDLRYLLRLFEGRYKIESFSYVDDKGILFENAALTDEGIDMNFGCDFGCGIFEMTKL